MIEAAASKSFARPGPGLSPAVSPLLWLNLSCLDAPIVAVTWQWMFARNFHMPIAFSARAALFFTAWLIYLSDRFVDARALDCSEIRTLRQEFCRQYFAVYASLIAIVGVVDAWIILRQLSSDILLLGAIVGSVSVAYLAVNYSLGKLWRRLPAKETFIGLLFACGTATALFATASSNRAAIAGLTFCFAALCVLNCVSIAVWERAFDLAQGKESLATRRSSLGDRLTSAGFALAIGFATLAFIFPAARVAFSCMCVSAAALAFLHFRQVAIPLPIRTALADLVLLTPIFFAIWSA